MNAKEPIRQNVEFSYMLLHAYVDDLSDSDLLVRPLPSCNHIAWQLGHMISATSQMLAALGHKPPALPEGYDQRYTKETSGSDDPAQFNKKAEYMAMADQMKAATLAAIDATPEDKLDQPAPEVMREYAPTVASGLMMLGSHWGMHLGQFVPIRRKLGKPPMF